MTDADIGVVGLAVMGQNLALNINDHGYKVAVYNRTASKVKDFLEGPAKGTGIVGAESLEEFIHSLKRPRKILFMIKAGTPVDRFIETVIPFLEEGDLIIDGGNSHFPDSERRTKELEKKGILYIGAGISGGEEGARHGPSIMPGGNLKGWPLVQDIFQSIAAKVDGQPCCEWVGEGGAGHYVKMVHNGIEYGDMQLISEAYHLMGTYLGMSIDEMQKIFAKWDEGELDSYLIEITAEILKRKEDGEPLVNKILDVANQKGTGKWTGINAFEMGIPVTLIGEAVFARCLSALKEERVKASELLRGPESSFEGGKENFIDQIEKALYASKIISYAQGFMLMREAAKEYDWKLHYGDIALMWRGGCIIRSRFLGNIKQAYAENPALQNLLLDSFFIEEIEKSQSGWRQVVSKAAQAGIPLPCMSTALAFYDGYRSERLPANLLQAQRDYFGAHTYERVDRPRGEFFHTEWTED